MKCIIAIPDSGYYKYITYKGNDVENLNDTLTKIHDKGFKRYKVCINSLEEINTLFDNSTDLEYLFILKDDKWYTRKHGSLEFCPIILGNESQQAITSTVDNISSEIDNLKYKVNILEQYAKVLELSIEDLNKSFKKDQLITNVIFAVIIIIIAIMLLILIFRR